MKSVQEGHNGGRHQSTAIAKAATFTLVGEGVLFQLSPKHLKVETVASALVGEDAG